MIRHLFDPPDRFDLARLRELLSERLGYRVETLTGRPPGGGPGELILEHQDTGEWLDVDPDVVAGVVAEVVAEAAAAPVRSPLDERTVEQLRAARTIEELRDALLAHFGERIEQQKAARERATAARQWVADQIRRESAAEGGGSR